MIQSQLFSVNKSVSTSLTNFSAASSFYGCDIGLGFGDFHDEHPIVGHPDLEDVVCSDDHHLSFIERDFEFHDAEFAHVDAHQFVVLAVAGFEHFAEAVLADTDHVGPIGGVLQVVDSEVVPVDGELLHELAVVVGVVDELEYLDGPVARADCEVFLNGALVKAADVLDVGDKAGQRVAVAVHNSHPAREVFNIEYLPVARVPHRTSHFDSAAHDGGQFHCGSHKRDFEEIEVVLLVDDQDQVLAAGEFDALGFQRYKVHVTQVNQIIEEELLLAIDHEHEVADRVFLELNEGWIGCLLHFHVLAFVRLREASRLHHRDQHIG